MNKFIAMITGKCPVVLNDIEFIDASIRDAFKGLVSAFGLLPKDSFKISGCNVIVNGNNYSWDAGYICLNGEILKVAAGSFTAPSPIPSNHGVYWALDISYDISGNKSFFDNQSHDTYQIRKGVLLYGEYPLDINNNPDFMPFNAAYIGEKILLNIDIENIKSAANATNEDWQPVTFKTGWSNASFGRGAAYKIDYNGIIYFRGVVQSGSGSTANIFDLPTDYKSRDDMYFNNIVIKDQNGVHCNPLTPIPSYVYLDGISYKL